mmetsp:Transcript_11143/g.29697  ORF Transcript_11143/g.29697 Transcript_11143/m.29697 type:complete len:207 (-) Transcript_11143:241-861(-)
MHQSGAEQVRPVWHRSRSEVHQANLGGAGLFARREDRAPRCQRREHPHRRRGGCKARGLWRVPGARGLAKHRDWGHAVHPGKCLLDGARGHEVQGWQKIRYLESGLHGDRDDHCRGPMEKVARGETDSDDDAETHCRGRGDTRAARENTQRLPELPRARARPGPHEAALCISVVEAPIRGFAGRAAEGSRQRHTFPGPQRRLGGLE